MKAATYDYILSIVHQTNILPVTSYCKMGCIFCSHRNNPEDIETYSLPVLSFDIIKDICEFLDGSRKIVIGESASRIMEGEPFLREDMVDILKHLRQRFPKAPIEVTTNGSYLTYEIAKELRNVEPLEVNISLNSSSKEGRRLLFRSGGVDNSVDALKYLKECGILFHGSIVAMPDVVGYGDIENTIAHLCREGASTVRVFVPGFSSLSAFNIDFFSTRHRLQEIADSLYEIYKVPVLVEPPEINSLEAKVVGVMKCSPGDVAGVIKGDVIVMIDGHEPFSRVDAYNLLYKKENPIVRLKRDDKFIDITILKQLDTPSGAVFYYDIHHDTIIHIEKAIIKNRSRRPLVVTSDLAFPVMTMALEVLKKYNTDICAVKNGWFGGTIMCAGLMTVKDIIEGVSFHTLHEKPDLIILPPAPFDIKGKDLRGKSFYEVEEALKVRTVLGE